MRRSYYVYSTGRELHPHGFSIACFSALDDNEGAGLTANTQYCYRVRACNDYDYDGSSDDCSAWAWDEVAEYQYVCGFPEPPPDPLPSVIELSDADVIKINGIDADDWSGVALSSGDVNGDGKSDIIIGAQRADPNGNGEAGETYIIYSDTSLPGTIELRDDKDIKDQ